MVRRREADEILFEQRLLVEARLEVGRETDGEVDFTRLEPARAVARDLFRFDAQTRRCLPRG